MRKTHATVKVALAMLQDPNARFWGYELAKAAGIRSGVLYPILGRMFSEGWLTDGWEDRESIEGNRPPRRYYELTDKGIAELGGLVRSAKSEPRFAGLQWGTA